MFDNQQVHCFMLWSLTKIFWSIDVYVLKGVHDHLPFFSGPIWKNEKTPLVINKNAYNDSQPPPILWKNFAIKKTQKSVAQAAETSKMWSAFQKLLQHLRNSDFQNFMFGTLTIKFNDFLQKNFEEIPQTQNFFISKTVIFRTKIEKNVVFWLRIFSRI